MSSAIHERTPWVNCVLELTTRFMPSIPYHTWCVSFNSRSNLFHWPIKLTLPYSSPKCALKWKCRNKCGRNVNCEKCGFSPFRIGCGFEWCGTWFDPHAERKTKKMWAVEFRCEYFSRWSAPKILIRIPNSGHLTSYPISCSFLWRSFFSTLARSHLCGYFARWHI